MTEVCRLPCPHVGCGSSDAFCWNTDKSIGHCKSCGIGYPSKGMSTLGWAKDKYPLVDRRSSGGWTAKEKESVDSYWDSIELIEEDEPEMTAKVTVKAVGDLKVVSQRRRGITEATLKHYGVSVYNDDLSDPTELNDMNPFKETYVYPSGGIKTRYIRDKGFSSEGGVNELWGMNLFAPNSSKTVVVTEGECDTMAAWQMLKTAQYITPVVSVPSASPSAKVWENSKEWLDSFDKIILSVDNDKAGDALAEKMSKMFLGKVYRMNHGKHKDANDFLMAGDGKDFKAAWWGAKKVKPESILSNPDDYVNLFRTSPDFEYFETGIPELDEKMLGICKGYITLIQAKSGLGKSELMRYFEYQLLTNSDYKVASCRKEETNLRSLLGLVSYDIKQNVTLKKLVEEGGLQEKVEESIQRLTEDERFVTFTIDETQSNDDTMKQLRYMIAAMGVDYIFIEPIQDIVVGSNASEKEGKLSDLITRMGNLCGDTGVGIVVIAHENNDGGAMYSSMITKKAGFKITLSGDRESDDPQERNRTYLEIKEKNRVGLGFGKAGAIDFDIGTYTLEPVVRHESVTKATKGDF